MHGDELHERIAAAITAAAAPILIPPPEVQRTAQQALDLIQRNHTHTISDAVRARAERLAAGDPIPRLMIHDLHRDLTAPPTYEWAEGDPDTDRHLVWYLSGGDAATDWTTRLVRRFELEEDPAERAAERLFRSLTAALDPLPDTFGIAGKAKKYIKGQITNPEFEKKIKRGQGGLFEEKPDIKARLDVGKRKRADLDQIEQEVWEKGSSPAGRDYDQIEQEVWEKGSSPAGRNYDQIAQEVWQSAGPLPPPPESSDGAVGELPEPPPEIDLAQPSDTIDIGDEPININQAAMEIMLQKEGEYDSDEYFALIEKMQNAAKAKGWAWNPETNKWGPIPEGMAVNPWTGDLEEIIEYDLPEMSSAFTVPSGALEERSAPRRVPVFPADPNFSPPANRSDDVRDPRTQLQEKSAFAWDSSAVEDFHVRAARVEDGVVLQFKLNPHKTREVFRNRDDSEVMLRHKYHIQQVADGEPFDLESTQDLAWKGNGSQLLIDLGDGTKLTVARGHELPFDGFVQVHAKGDHDPLMLMQRVGERLGISQDGPSENDLDTYRYRKIAAVFDPNTGDLLRADSIGDLGMGDPSDDDYSDPFLVDETQLDDVLMDIELEWGDEVFDGEWVEDERGRQRYLLPQSVADAIVEKTGTDVFIHEIYNADWIPNALMDVGQPFTLKATTARWTEGLKTWGSEGKSPEVDVNSGGAEYVFLRQRNSTNEDMTSYANGTVRLNAARLLRRTDWYSYDHDVYGARDPRDPDYQYTIQGVTRNIEALTMNNMVNPETMFKGSIEVGQGELQPTDLELRSWLKAILDAHDGVFPEAVLRRVLFLVARRDGTQYEREDLLKVIEDLGVRRAGGWSVADVPPRPKDPRRRYRDPYNTYPTI